MRRDAIRYNKKSAQPSVIYSENHQVSFFQVKGSVNQSQFTKINLPIPVIITARISNNRRLSEISI